MARLAGVKPPSLPRSRGHGSSSYSAAAVELALGGEALGGEALDAGVDV